MDSLGRGMVGYLEMNAGILLAEFLQYWQQQTVQGDFTDTDGNGTLLQAPVQRQFTLCCIYMLTGYGNVFKQLFAFRSKRYASVGTDEEDTSQFSLQTFNDPCYIRLIALKGSSSLGEVFEFSRIIKELIVLIITH